MSGDIWLYSVYLYGDDQRMQCVNIEKSELLSIPTVLNPLFKIAKIFWDHEPAVSRLKERFVENLQDKMYIYVSWF